MVPIVKPATEFIAGISAGNGPLKVLDVAAGHGLFGIAIALKNPEAQIHPLDWEEVLSVAKENAEKAGVTGRYHPLPGDAFEIDFGGPYDLVLVTNFLHHFDRPTCETLAKKIRKCIAPGGKVITLEFVPNEDRISPPAAASFSMMMLGLTAAGDAYTFSEISGMYQAAGFLHNEFMEVPQSPEAIVISSL
jgi:2-polyprenyl-3-methyl-5-hydroxy-6-metoxy-1,4-benzoquinol methylase